MRKILASCLALSLMAVVMGCTPAEPPAPTGSSPMTEGAGTQAEALGEPEGDTPAAPSQEEAQPE